MVWLIIGLPLAAVVAGIITVAIAARNADTLVEGDIHKEGLAFHRSTERDQLAGRLGLSAAVQLTDDRLRVELQGRLDPAPEWITLSFVHPTDAHRDIKTTLARLDSGLYGGKVGELDGVNYQVVVEPADNAWRLAGHWAARQGEKLRLSAVKSDLPTRP